MGVAHGCCRDRLTRNNHNAKAGFCKLVPSPHCATCARMRASMCISWRAQAVLASLFLLAPRACACACMFGRCRLPSLVWCLPHACKVRRTLVVSECTPCLDFAFSPTLVTFLGPSYRVCTAWFRTQGVVVIRWLMARCMSSWKASSTRKRRGMRQSAQRARLRRLGRVCVVRVCVVLRRRCNRVTWYPSNPSAKPIFLAAVLLGLGVSSLVGGCS